jgi:hypothetical protein
MTGGHIVETREPGAILAAVVVVLIVFIAPPVGAEGGSLIPGLGPVKGPVDLGIIFNTTDLLLGLQSYQAGLGAKVGWGNFCLRGLFDLTVNGSAKASAVNLGATAEYHIFPGPISPYVGASMGGGYIGEAGVSSSVSFSLSALAGVEVFIADFLSVFAEYELAATFTSTTDLQANQSTFDYLISTGMGNNTKLGIVIYIMRSGANK